jgi:hypothetical protein
MNDRFCPPPSYVRGNEFYSIENEKQVRLKGAPDASYASTAMREPAETRQPVRL